MFHIPRARIGRFESLTLNFQKISVGLSKGFRSIPDSKLPGDSRSIPKKFSTWYDVDEDHADAHTAFLHDNLSEQLYIQHGKGLVVKGKDTKVFCIVKSMLGLRQENSVYYQGLGNVLTPIGFIHSKVDQFAYY